MAHTSGVGNEAAAATEAAAPDLASAPSDDAPGNPTDGGRSFDESQSPAEIDKQNRPVIPSRDIAKATLGYNVSDQSSIREPVNDGLPEASPALVSSPRETRHALKGSDSNTKMFLALPLTGVVSSKTSEDADSSSKNNTFLSRGSSKFSGSGFCLDDSRQSFQSGRTVVSSTRTAVADAPPTPTTPSRTMQKATLAYKISEPDMVREVSSVVELPVKGSSSMDVTNTPETRSRREVVKAPLQFNISDDGVPQEPSSDTLDFPKERAITQVNSTMAAIDAKAWLQSSADRPGAVRVRGAVTKSLLASEIPDDVRAVVREPSIGMLDQNSTITRAQLSSSMGAVDSKARRSSPAQRPGAVSAGGGPLSNSEPLLGFQTPVCGVVEPSNDMLGPLSPASRDRVRASMVAIDAKVRSSPRAKRPGAYASSGRSSFTRHSFGSDEGSRRSLDETIQTLSPPRGQVSSIMVSKVRLSSPGTRPGAEMVLLEPSMELRHSHSTDSMDSRGSRASADSIKLQSITRAAARQAGELSSSLRSRGNGSTRSDLANSATSTLDTSASGEGVGVSVTDTNGGADSKRGSYRGSGRVVTIPEELLPESPADILAATSSLSSTRPDQEQPADVERGTNLINAPVTPMYVIEQETEAKREKLEKKLERQAIMNHRCLIAVLILVAIGAIVGITLGVLGGGDDDGKDDIAKPSVAPTVQPTQAPTHDFSHCTDETASAIESFGWFDNYSSIREIVGKEDGGYLSAIDKPSSPQRLALCWLSVRDGFDLGLNEPERVIQRYTLAVLAYTMLEFKSSRLFGGTPASPGWLTSSHECEWLDVFCDNETDTIVIDLLMHHAKASGSIPSELTSLTKLESFDARENGLVGTYPEFLWSMSNLKALDLSFNKFEGSFPDRVLGLPNLVVLRLNANREVFGNMPNALWSTLTNLKTLDLSELSLSGSISTEIGLLTSLNGLGLQQNNLSGTVPTEIGLLSQLQMLRLGANGFSEFSTIPTELGNLGELLDLELERGPFYGTIPTELGRLTNLNIKLVLRYNSLAGEIPTELGRLVNARQLLIDGNAELSGTMPSEICSLRIPDGVLEALSVNCDGTLTDPVKCECCKCPPDTYP